MRDRCAFPVTSSVFELLTQSAVNLRRLYITTESHIACFSVHIFLFMMCFINEDVTQMEFVNEFCQGRTRMTISYQFENDQSVREIFVF